MHLPRPTTNDSQSLSCDSGIAGIPAIATIESEIDLSGSPRPERLVVEENAIVVLSAHNDERRWPLDCIEDYRLEAAIGSCFLQAQVDGQWIDVLRRPGNPDADLARLVDALKEIKQSGDWYVAQEHDRAGDGQVLSRWFAEPNQRPSRRRRWQTAWKVLSLMRPFRGTMLLMLGLSVAAVAIDVAPPMLQKYLVDGVLQAAEPQGRMSQLLQLLLAIVAGLLMIRLTSTLVTVWKARIASRVGTTLTANLRDELVKKLNELPLAYHDRNQVGMLMSRVAYDTETLHTLLHHLTGGLLLELLQLFGIGVMLFYLNPKLALVTMLPMPLILAGGWYFTRYLNPRHQHYWEAVGKQASSLMGMLSGIRVVKSFVQEDREVDRFSASSRRLRDSRQAVDISTSMFAASMGLLFALGTLAVWYIGGYDVLHGKMTLGSLIAFLAYLAMFYAPLTSVAESTTWFSSFFTASRRIFDLLETPSEIDEGEPASPSRRLEGRVQFENVAFGYDKSRRVLHEIDLAIEPGEMVGVVGRSGSGKSTLVSLIARLYDVDSGRVLLDGVDVRELDARQLRRHIGMVPQEPFLFRGTVAENIAYGNPAATPAQILRAARQADTHDFIMRKPLAYETQLGEGGSGFSGGERQRLSIARALLYDPAILVLDEATASVDAESEKAICDAIRRFSRRRTTIVIAHRLSTLRDADRLLVFDMGRLIEQGSHEELLAHGGLYSNLVRLQSSLHESRRRIESFVGANGAPDGRTTSELTGDQDFFAEFQGVDDDGESEASRHSPDEMEECLLRWLDPGRDRIASEGNGLLRVLIDEQEYSGVYAVAAFPLTHPRSLISLRKKDPSGREVELGLLKWLDEWPREAQTAVARPLARRYFFRSLREIQRIRASGNTLYLSALSDGGTVELEVEKTGEGFQRFGRDGLLLLDVRGGYYVIPDRRNLPRQQQRLLNLYLGD